MGKLKHILFLAFAIASLNVFAQNSDSLRKERVALLDSLYADFIGQEVRDNYDSAYSILKKCYEIDPEAAELNYQMGLYDKMFASRDTTQNQEEAMQRLIEKLKIAYTKEPDNKKYIHTLLNASAQAGDTTTIQPLLEKLIELDKTNEQYISILMQMYDGKKEYEKEMELLDRLETYYGKSTATELTRVEIMKNLYGEKKALKYINSLINKSPKESGYILYMAQHYREKEEYKKALPYYEKALEQNPNDGTIRYSYISCLESMGQEAEARQLAIEAVNDPKSPIELKVQIVKDLLETFESEPNGTERMMQVFRKALEQPQETSDMTDLYLQYMKLQKWAPDSIVTALKDVLKIEPTNEYAYLVLLDYYGTRNKKEEVIDVCKRAIDNGVKKLELYYYRAIFNYQLDNKDEALRLLREAVEQRQFANNTKLYADCYGMIGSIYHEKDSLPKAFEAFEDCLKWNPENASTLNNYAYYLTLEGKDLDKAEQMSRKSITIEPKNGTYLDTYAWVLYAQERYEEAADYINRAVSDTESISAEIYDHAGDIYLKLNEIEAAMAYWELAHNKATTEGADTTAIDSKIKKYSKKK
ncbi:MAG: tetratricopeptide repeat protein [Bacteroidaceae bacterium]|nr:tetratricopeptide repeat protein [Bacteroidaceae bacterium]